MERTHEPRPQVTFLKSSPGVGQLPPATLPEVAFIGRSNVGKSSLINALVQRKELAKTSGTPGKTQLINHFSVAERWYLVDLPGYGYAQVSQARRKQFEDLIWGYLERRTTLLVLLVLIDLRHAPLSNDLEFLERVGTAGIPFAIVFTKADKLSASQREGALHRYHETLAQTWEPLPTTYVTSSETGYGIDTLWKYLTQLIQTHV